MIIDEIIEILGREDPPLTTALMKTKVLLHTLGKKELAQWVDYELTGYPDDVELPAYRKVQVVIRGHLRNISVAYENQPLPVMHLSEKQRDILTDGSLGQSITELERLASGDRAALELPPEWYSAFDKGLAPGFHVYAASKNISPLNIAGILTIVRSRLLDFVLELRDEFGPDAKEADLKEKAKNIDMNQLFRNSIFGPNSTFIIGDRNIQSVQNGVQTLDRNSLTDQLREAGVTEDELENLKEAIDGDSKDGKPSMAGQTGAWFLRLWLFHRG
jgi:hypothetical protein